MEMEVIKSDDSLLRVALKGRLDSPGVEAIELKFNATIAPARTHTLVDLSGVSFLSSLGIRMLLTMARILNRANARFILHSPQSLVLESIRHAALDEIIPVTSDEAGALAAIPR